MIISIFIITDSQSTIAITFKKEIDLTLQNSRKNKVFIKHLLPVEDLINPVALKLITYTIYENMIITSLKRTSNVWRRYFFSLSNFCWSKNNCK